MKFKPALIHVTFIKRYKRFLADVILDSSKEKLTVYVPNTGSLLSCNFPDSKACLSHHPGGDRKLPYTLEMIHSGASWVGINTSITNMLVEEALIKKQISSLKNFNHIQREVSIMSSRIDFCLTNENEEKAYVEVKSVSYKSEKEKNLAQFPDAVTTRGLKHLEDLIRIKKSGHRAVIFYLIQREDVERFSIAEHIDPEYAKGFKKALKNGVEVLVYRANVSPKEITIAHEVPWTP